MLGRKPSWSDGPCRVARGSSTRISLPGELQTVRSSVASNSFHSTYAVHDLKASKETRIKKGKGKEKLKGACRPWEGSYVDQTRSDSHSSKTGIRAVHCPFTMQYPASCMGRCLVFYVVFFSPPMTVRRPSSSASHVRVGLGRYISSLAKPGTLTKVVIQ